jgi:hypothetical protein
LEVEIGGKMREKGDGRVKKSPSVLLGFEDEEGSP